MALLGCADGYPNQDAVSVGAMTPAEHVRMLDTYLDDTVNAVAFRSHLQQLERRCAEASAAAGSAALRR